MTEDERPPVAGVLGYLDQDIADHPRNRAGETVDHFDELARRRMEQARQRRLVLQGCDGSSLPFVHVGIIAAGTAATRSFVRSA